MNTPRSDAPTLVGISFANMFGAQGLLLAGGGLDAGGALTLKDAVTVVKDDAGRTVVHETIDPSPGHSALSGARWAGLFGLIRSGPVGWIAGLAVGAGAGVVTAEVADLGIFRPVGRLAQGCCHARDRHRHSAGRGRRW